MTRRVFELSPASSIALLKILNVCFELKDKGGVSTLGSDIELSFKDGVRPSLVIGANTKVQFMEYSSSRLYGKPASGARRDPNNFWITVEGDLWTITVLESRTIKVTYYAKRVPMIFSK